MNPARQTTLLIISRGGMEITWRYAWALFLTLILLNRPLFFAESLAVFTIAGLVTHLSSHRYRRVYQSLGLHFLGFTMVWLLTIYRFHYPQLPFFNSSWVVDWFLQHQKPQPWFVDLLIVACLLLFWLGARATLKKTSTYYPVCLQFDKGLGALFLLLLIKFIAQEKGGLRWEDPVTIHLLFGFFTFSLIAISLSRNQSAVQKSFRPGYHGIGIVLGFASVVLVVSAILAVILLPHLTLMAYSAQSILAQTAEPMHSVLVDIIRFLFSIGRYRQEMGGRVAGGSNGDRLYPGSEIGWAQGFGWFLLAVIGLATLWLCGYLIRWLVARFLNRNTEDNSRQPPMNVFTNLLALIGVIFQLVWNGLLFLLRRIDSAAAVYAGLLRWGRRSGVPAASSDTPLEYGQRLMQRFPQLRTEIETIIEAFNREIYGQFHSSKRRLARIQTAQRRMRNPRHWPSRIKTWFAPPPV